MTSSFCSHCWSIIIEAFYSSLAPVDLPPITDFLPLINFDPLQPNIVKPLKDTHFAVTGLLAPSGYAFIIFELLLCIFLIK